jgi:uncharacterized protein
MTMSPGTTELIEAGLRAWASGDLDALEAVLDPGVSLRWFEPGEWDCANREQVMALLRQHQTEGEQPPAMRIDRLDENTFVVSPAYVSDPNRSESFPATLITIAHGKVSQMQQYHSRADALRSRATKAGRNRPEATSLSDDDVAAAEAVEAVHAGDLPALRHLLAGNPGLAASRPPGQGGRTLRLVVTDWPGHFANSAATVRALVAAGADVNAANTGKHAETPLHWAASSDGIEALDALLDAGADIDAPGAVIGGGTPLADATAFGQWQAAHRLVERGARTTLWEAASLGLLTQMAQHIKATTPSREEITSSFWGACHGGQPETAAYLLEAGADINWVGFDNLTPLDAAQRAGTDGLVEWLRTRGAKSTADLN